MLDSLPLSPKQIKSIAHANARINIWHGAIRSGKTIASLVAFLIAIAIAVAPHSGPVVIVGRSLQAIERNVLDPLMDESLFGPVARMVHHTRGATTTVILGRPSTSSAQQTPVRRAACAHDRVPRLRGRGHADPTRLLDTAPRPPLCARRPPHGHD